MTSANQIYNEMNGQLTSWFWSYCEEMTVVIAQHFCVQKDIFRKVKEHDFVWCTKAAVYKRPGPERQVFVFGQFDLIRLKLMSETLQIIFHESDILFNAWNLCKH